MRERLNKKAGCKRKSALLSMMTIFSSSSHSAPCLTIKRWAGGHQISASLRQKQKRTTNGESKTSSTLSTSKLTLMISPPGISLPYLKSKITLSHQTVWFLSRLSLFVSIVNITTLCEWTPAVPTKAGQTSLISGSQSFPQESCHLVLELKLKRRPLSKSLMMTNSKSHPSIKSSMLSQDQMCVSLVSTSTM